MDTTSSEMAETSMDDFGQSGEYNQNYPAYWRRISLSLEWGAYNISPRGIIIEEFLMGDDGGPPIDIKMHCFGGKVGYIQFEHGRFGSEILQNIHLPDGSLIDTKGANKVVQ